MGPSHRPQFFQNSSSTGPFYGDTAPAQVPHRPQFLPDLLLLRGLPSGCSLLQGVSTCCSSAALCGLQRDRLLHQGPLHGLQGNLGSGTLGTSPSSSSSCTGVCRAVSLLFFSLLSLTAAAQQFHPFLNTNDRGSVSITDGFIFAQRRVCF